MKNRLKDAGLHLLIWAGLALFAVLYAQVTQAQGIVAKADSAVQAVKNTITAADTAQISHRIYNDIKAGLSGMASALKVGVEHVYVIMVKQQIVSAITRTIAIVVAAILALICWRLFSKGHTLEKAEYHQSHNRSGYTYDTSEWGAKVVLPFVGGLLFTTIFIFSFSFSIDKIVMGLINPEYGALKDILEFVRH